MGGSHPVKQSSVCPPLLHLHESRHLPATGSLVTHDSCASVEYECADEELERGLFT